MFNSLWADLKKEYKYSNKVIRLIFINIGIFLLIKLIGVILFISFGTESHQYLGKIIHYLSVSADPLTFAMRPWTWVSHMFLHEGFLHVIFNMLYLYWFGRIVGDLLGDKRIYPLYFIGGWMGMMFFFVFANLTPAISTNAFAYGASAAVMAITAAAGAITPNSEMRLIFLGSVKLKYIVAVLLLVDLLSIGVSNTGGHIAHLGGMFWGFLYIYLLKSGKETGGFINRILDRKTFKAPIFKKKSQDPYKPTLTVNVNRGYRQDDTIDLEYRLDQILEKIKKKGLDKLTAEEKQFLDDASQRKK